MDLRKCLLTKNECYKTGKKITVKGVMWHSTGANNPNLKRYVQPDDGKLGTNSNGNHWNQNRPDGRQVCVHAFIGKDKNGNVCTYQTLPWNYRGWHCGGSGNDNYIGFEICEDALTDKDYFNKVYKEAVELTAYLCKEYNLDPNGNNVIICHQDGHKLGIASNHSDVYHWFNKFGKDMADVRKDVAAAMGKTTSSGSTSSSKPSTGSSTSSTSYYKAFNSTSIVDGLKSIGVDSSFANRKKIAAANGISNYEGTASQNSKLCSLAKQGKLKKAGSSSSSSTSSTSYYKKFSDDSIVDGLKSIGVDSSFANRKKIAKANGISNYEGTASQNTKLLSLAKQGKLKKP